MLVREPIRHVQDFICDSRHWAGYQPRADDIVVATAAKVGTTWTQRIVSLLVFQTPDPVSIMHLSPWLDCRFQMPIEMALSILEAQTHRRFIKSHLPFDALPIFDEARYIHVARDPRDACLSFMHHFNNFTPASWEGIDQVGLNDPTIGRATPRPPRTAPEFFDYWLGEGDEVGAPMMSNGFFALERSYWSERKRPNLLMLHYGDMIADLDAEMRRISAFLGIPVNPAIWPDLVEAATFESMRRDGAQVLAGFERAFQGGSDSFLNRGGNERWRGEVGEAALQRYAARLATETTPAQARWLELGRRGAGDPAATED